MSYTSTSTLLDQVSNAENGLREVQQKLRDQESEPVTQYILDHFQRTESIITEIMKEMREDLDETTLGVVHQIEPAYSPENIFAEYPESTDAEDLVNWSLKCQQHLAEWCKHLADKTTSSKAADLFSRLHDRMVSLNRQLAADTRSLVQK